MSVFMADVMLVLSCYAEKGGHSQLNDFLWLLHYLYDYSYCFSFFYAVTKLVVLKSL